MTDDIPGESQTSDPALYPWMKMGWFARFGIGAILGPAIFLVGLSRGENGVALAGLGLGAVCWIFVIYMLTHR